MIYSNDFEDGVGTATIIGSGQIVSDTTPGFGSVFHNAIDGQAIRTNYLVLPKTIFLDLQSAESHELTIAFWVNVGTATDYYYTPLFSTYGNQPIDGANTWPMMVLESRLWAQINCGGWTDLTATENVEGTNLESTTWLDDSLWHYYIAMITDTTVIVMVDGSIQNKWVVSETDGNKASGIFTNGSELDYIALGGN